MLPRGLISFADRPRHQLEINLITNILLWTIGRLWIHHKILMSIIYIYIRWKWLDESIHLTSSDTQPKSNTTKSTRRSEFSLLSLAYILARKLLQNSTLSIAIMLQNPSRTIDTRGDLNLDGDNDPTWFLQSPHPPNFIFRIEAMSSERDERQVFLVLELSTKSYKKLQELSHL